MLDIISDNTFYATILNQHGSVISKQKQSIFANNCPFTIHSCAILVDISRNVEMRDIGFISPWIYYRHGYSP